MHGEAAARRRVRSPDRRPSRPAAHFVEAARTVRSSRIRSRTLGCVFAALDIGRANHLRVAYRQRDRTRLRALKPLRGRIEPRVLQCGNLMNAGIQHAHHGRESFGAVVETTWDLAICYPERSRRQQALRRRGAAVRRSRGCRRPVIRSAKRSAHPPSRRFGRPIPSARNPNPRHPRNSPVCDRRESA